MPRRLLVSGLASVTIGALPQVAHATPKATPATTVLSLGYEVEHPQDGKKYPNQLIESYALDGDGLLRYSGYFGGVPLEFNHNDAVTWPSGAAGRQLLALAQQLANRKGSGLQPLPDGASLHASPEGVLRVSVARGALVLAPGPSPARTQLTAALAKFLAAFEKATGRPLTLDKLPQAPRR